MIYLFKNGGGSGQLIRRNLIDKPLLNKGLSGWVIMQEEKYKQYPSAFHSGVWINLLDMINTDKYKEVSDYPEYDKMIRKMRPYGLGYSQMNIMTLEKIKREMRDWYNKNVSRLHNNI